jgi:endonuclease G
LLALWTTACGTDVVLVAHDDDAASIGREVDAVPFPAQRAVRAPALSALPFAPPMLDARAAPTPVPDLPAPPSETVPDPLPSGPRGLDVSPHLALGLPDGSGVGQATHWLLLRAQYATSYDTTRKVPNWSSWTLETSDFGPATRATTFKIDPILPSTMPQAHDTDYRLSGFDRGHLCPSADRTATDADNDATFFLTNVVPQTHASNAGPWLDLEDESRQLATRGKHLLIIAGPIFAGATQSIGTGVQVPTAMFKVAVVVDGALTPENVSSSTRVYAAIIPNSTVVSGSWRQWQVTAREVEEQTGLDFLSDLPRSTQDLLESRIDP